MKFRSIYKAGRHLQDKGMQTLVFDILEHSTQKKVAIHGKIMWMGMLVPAPQLEDRMTQARQAATTQQVQQGEAG